MSQTTNFLPNQKLKKHLFLQAAAVLVLCLAPQINVVSYGQESCELPSCVPLPLQAQPLQQDDESFLSLGAIVRDEYFLGEVIPLKITLTNTSSEKKTVKDMRTRKFNLRLDKVSQIGAEGDLVREINYDARYHTLEEKKMDKSVRESISKRIETPRDWRQLQPNEVLSLNLPAELASFTAQLETGEYRLTITSGSTQPFTTVFKINFDREKSVPVFAKLLQSESDAEQNWAVYQLRQNDIASLWQLLNELEQSSSEKLRMWARYTISRITNGH